MAIRCTCLLLAYFAIRWYIINMSSNTACNFFRCPTYAIKWQKVKLRCCYCYASVHNTFNMVLLCLHYLQTWYGFQTLKSSNQISGNIQRCRCVSLAECVEWEVLKNVGVVLLCNEMRYQKLIMHNNENTTDRT